LRNPLGQQGVLNQLTGTRISNRSLHPTRQTEYPLVNAMDQNIYESTLIPNWVQIKSNCNPKRSRHQRQAKSEGIEDWGGQDDEEVGDDDDDVLTT